MSIDVKTWLNGAGVALTIAGGVMVWRFSPPHFHGIDSNLVDDEPSSKSRTNQVDRAIG